MKSCQKVCQKIREEKKKKDKNYSKNSTIEFIERTSKKGKKDLLKLKTR